MAQLQADAAKLESRAASYNFGHQPLGPSLMCSTTARWGLLGWKRPADKNEEGCENEHLANRVRKMFAEQSTVQKPANVRSVPMVFPY